MKYDEEKLWRAIVTGAIQALLGKSKKLREEAQAWVNSESFAVVCDLANLDFERTKTF